MNDTPQVMMGVSGMNKTAYIMIGVSGAGKSTAIKKLAKCHKAEGKVVMIFSLDTCREILIAQEHAGQWWSDLDTPQSMYAHAFDFANSHQKEFDELVNRIWATDLKADVLFVDNTNLTRKSRARWINDAKQKGFDVVGVQLLCPLATVIERQKTRKDKSVPENVVRDMYMRQQEVLVGDEVDALMVIDGTKESTWEMIYA